MEITDSNLDNQLLKNVQECKEGLILVDLTFVNEQNTAFAPFAYVKRRHARLLRFKAATKTHFTILDPADSLCFVQKAYKKLLPNISQL